MNKKESSKTVHSDSSERDPLFEAAGIVGPNRRRKPREVLVDLPTLEAMLKTN